MTLAEGWRCAGGSETGGKDVSKTFENPDACDDAHDREECERERRALKNAIMTHGAPNNVAVSDAQRVADQYAHTTVADLSVHDP